MSAIDILKEDFNSALSLIDFEKPYDPYSKDFMKPLFIGMLLTAMKDNGDDVEEELDGASKYWQMYLKTNDVQYKEMSNDELKHAGILIKKHLVNADEKKKEHLNSLEKKRQEMLKVISSKEIE